MRQRTALAIHRFAQGYSQVELAENAGVDPLTIHRLENGRKPSRKTANAIAFVLDRPVEMLFPSSDQPHELQGIMVGTEGVT